MKLQIVALFPVRLPELLSRPGTRERKRKNGGWTQVDCTLKLDGDRTFAVIPHQIPDGVPPAVFRVQVEMTKADDGGKAVVVVLPAAAKSSPDPEQRIQAPTYTNGRRCLFEFQDAELLIVTAQGRVELRTVAVHPVTGQVGTRTTLLFHSRFAKLVTRCHAHLAGTIDLYPALEVSFELPGTFTFRAGPRIWIWLRRELLREAQAPLRLARPAIRRRALRARPECWRLRRQRDHNGGTE